MPRLLLRQGDHLLGSKDKEHLEKSESIAISAQIRFNYRS